MRQLAKRLTLMCVVIVSCGTMATALTLFVKYKPYGVPDSRRGEYESKIAQLEQRSQLLKDLQTQIKPVAFIAKANFDFGLLEPHGQASHSFVLENRGDGPLALEVQETSCKCTVGSVGDAVVQPGESTEVTMTWNTGLQSDEYKQQALIKTNDPANELITLTVRGQVRSEFTAPESISFPVSDRAQVVESSFVVYSQLWESFEVTDVESDLEAFEWYAEPIGEDMPEFATEGSRSAWKVRVFAASDTYGGFTGSLKLTARPGTGGEDVVRTIEGSGRVRAPIGFYSPEIHRDEGLDIGTVKSSGKQQDFHLIVRARGQSDRKIDVLDVKPDELTASLEPMKKDGTYRLTVTVPANCPSVVFNADLKHGYVQVGDVRDPSYSNWFPLLGAVIQAK